MHHRHSSRHDVERITLNLLDESGHPFPPRIVRVIERLTPGLRRRYSLRDEEVLAEILEDAARRIAERERRRPPIENLYGYVSVTLRNAARSRLRRPDVRRTLSSAVVLSRVHATSGSAEEVERHILWQEVLDMLSPQERTICTLKGAGHSSTSIARRLGLSIANVDTCFSRAKSKIRQRLRHGRSHDA